MNGLFPEALGGDAPVRLGFLPLGTGNSFLRDFSDQGADYAVQSIIEGRQRACDVLQLRHRDGVLYFINLMSMGFVADVCTLANQRFKRFGDFGYVLGVFSMVANLRASRFPLRVDQGPTQDDAATFVSINNSRFTGGKMMMAPQAETADGLADLIHVGEMGRFSLLRTFPGSSRGLTSHTSTVRQCQVQSIDFELPNEVDVMIDGEVLRILPQQLRVLPGALGVRV